MKERTEEKVECTKIKRVQVVEPLRLDVGVLWFWVAVGGRVFFLGQFVNCPYGEYGD